jgi:hypothetical protein
VAVGPRFLRLTQSFRSLGILEISWPTCLVLHVVSAFGGAGELPDVFPSPADHLGAWRIPSSQSADTFEEASA